MQIDTGSTGGFYGLMRRTRFIKLEVPQACLPEFELVDLCSRSCGGCSQRILMECIVQGWKAGHRLLLSIPELRVREVIFETRR